MRLRIVTSNIFAGNRNPVLGVTRLSKATRPWLLPDSMGLQEAGNAVPELNKVPDFDAYWTHSKNRHVRHNVTMVNRMRTRVVFRGWVVVPGTGTRVTPPRTITETTYHKRNKKIAHINTHFHVVAEEELALKTEGQWSEPAQQYVEHIEELKAAMLHYYKKGYIVFVTADGNTKPKPGKPEWEYSAYKALDGWQGFQVLRNDVDILVYNSRQVKVLKKKIIPKNVVGSDHHDAIAGLFKVRRPRR